MVRQSENSTKLEIFTKSATPGRQIACHIEDSRQVGGVQSVLRVISYLKRYPLLGGAQFLCAAVMAASVIIFPLTTRHILGVVIPEKDYDVFVFWVLLALA